MKIFATDEIAPTLLTVMANYIKNHPEITAEELVTELTQVCDLINMFKTNN